MNRFFNESSSEIHDMLAAFLIAKQCEGECECVRVVTKYVKGFPDVHHVSFRRDGQEHRFLLDEVGANGIRKLFGVDDARIVEAGCRV